MATVESPPVHWELAGGPVPVRDHAHERGTPLETERRCHACSRPAVTWVTGRFRTLPICNVCRWARSRAYRPRGWR